MRTSARRYRRRTNIYLNPKNKKTGETLPGFKLFVHLTYARVGDG